MVHRRLESFHAGIQRHHRVSALASCPQIVAARPRPGGWEIHVIRHGRLAAAETSSRGDDARAIAESAARSAQSVARPVPPLPAATIEETERIADWLESDGVRIIEIDGEWSLPLHLGHRLERLGPPASDDASQIETGQIERGLASYDPLLAPGPLTLVRMPT